MFLILPPSSLRYRRRLRTRLDSRAHYSPAHYSPTDEIARTRQMSDAATSEPLGRSGPGPDSGRVGTGDRSTAVKAIDLTGAGDDSDTGFESGRQDDDGSDEIVFVEIRKGKGKARAEGRVVGRASAGSHSAAGASLGSPSSTIPSIDRPYSASTLFLYAFQVEPNERNPQRSRVEKIVFARRPSLQARKLSNCMQRRLLRIHVRHHHARGMEDERRSALFTGRWLSSCRFLSRSLPRYVGHAYGLHSS